MTTSSSGVQPGTGPGTGAVPGNSSVTPKGPASNSDSDAFGQALDETAAESGKEKKALTGEEQLRKIMSEQSMKQFMERSKELTDEIKKNMEG